MPLVVSSQASERDDAGGGGAGVQAASSTLAGSAVSGPASLNHVDDDGTVLVADTSTKCGGALACRPFTLEQKWFRQFFVGILICVNNGACFTFGIFSPFMKQGGFRYTQGQVNIVSTVGVLLSYFSMPNGYLFDRKGPSATLLAGTVLNVTGWAGMFLVFVNMEHPLLSNSVVVMCIFYGLSQFSASFYETGSVLTNLRAFSCYKGRVVVIQKTFMGLGSSIVAQLYVAFFERTFATIAPFFLFLMSFSAVAGALSVLYVRLPTTGTWCVGLNVPDLATLARGGGESSMFDRPFNVGTVILVCAVGFVLLVSLIENFVPELSTTARALIGATTLALVTSFTSMMAVTPSYPQNVGGFHEAAEDAAKRAALVAANPSSSTTVAGPALPVSAAAQEGADHGWARGQAALLAETPRHTNAAFGGCNEEELPVCELPPPPPTNTLGERPYATAKPSRPRSYGCFSPPTSCGHEARRHSETSVPVDGPGSTPSVVGSVSAGATQRSKAPAIVLNDAPLLSNLRHREIWLLWYICFAAWGAMTLVSSNSSQIYQAVAYHEFSLTVNTVFVSIYGVASAVGRILVGAAQPMMERRRIPIASFLIGAPFLNLIGLPLFLVSSASGLFLPFFMVGFATGVSWGSSVLIITSFFTTTNCGKHYSWLYTAGMLSPLVFNIGLFGPIYDRHSAEQGREGDHSCKGVVCVQTSLLVCMVVNLVAIPCAFYFTKRTSRRGGIRT